MPELQNLLRQRLAGTENGPTQAHPDADTLTAYSEQSLPAAERQMVVAHLSVCEPCREVIALAQAPLPEMAVQTVLQPAPVSVWRRFLTPAFGLGASVAAMAIIAVLVLQLPQKNQQQAPQQQASSQAPVSPSADHPAPQVNDSTMGDQAAPTERAALPATPSETKAGSATGMEIGAKAREARPITTREETSRPSVIAELAAPAAAPAPPPPSKTLGLLAHDQKKDYINTNFFATERDNVVLSSQNASLPSTPQPQSAGATNAFTTNGSKMTMFADLPANAAGKSNVRLLTPTPPQEHAGCTVCKIVNAGVHTLHLHPSGLAPAFRSSTLGTSAIGGNGMFSATLAKNHSIEASAAPEKSEAGALASSDALSPGAMSVSSSRYATSPTWKVVGGKLLKSFDQAQWEDAYPSAGFEFSFVDSRGRDVWAGGSHASIIHSRDGGLTWENVRLGDAATGTIQNIVAASASIQVKTSDNQTWASQDGGKTWTMTND